MLQSFPVPGKLAEEHWHITEKELFYTAWKNTEVLFLASLKSLNQVIADFAGNYAEKPHKEVSELIYENDPLPFDWYIFWKDGHIPENYQLQCHHYMAVTGADAWYIAVVILEKDFLWHRIERDEDLIRNLISIESDFWISHVIPKIMPEPDGSESSERLIRQLTGKAAFEKEIPQSGFDEQLKRRMEIAELMAKLDTERKTIEQKLKLYMGDAEIAENDRYHITWKNSRGFTESMRRPRKAEDFW